jgi:mycothiol synthase
MAGDLEALAPEVERARAASEFRASSDPDAAFILKSFGVDPSILGGAFVDGELVGFVSSEFKVIAVRPTDRRQGIGRRLVDLASAMERARGRPDVIIGRLPDDEPARAFLQATGFTFHSTLWDLALPPTTMVAAPSWPPGLAGRTFDPARDVQPWVDLFNVAFADHPTPLQLVPSLVVAGLGDPTIDDADTLVLEEDGTGDLVGFCATAPTRIDGRVEPRAEIWTIGVRPDRQGRGLGRQLLRWGVRRLREIGVEEVTLSVNARNDRALALYEAEGFVRSRARQRWARPVGDRPEARA